MNMKKLLIITLALCTGPATTHVMHAMAKPKYGNIIAYGVHALQGNRPTMEDAHAILPSDSPQFFGVFDGHSGIETANYAAEHLYENIVKALKDQKLGDTYDVTEFVGRRYARDPRVLPSTNRMASSIIRGVYATDQKAIETLTIKQMRGKKQSGSTAIFALQDITNNNLYIAWIGDSAAVLADANGKPLWRSIDQTLKIDGGNFAQDKDLFPTRYAEALTRAKEERVRVDGKPFENGVFSQYSSYITTGDLMAATQATPEAKESFRLGYKDRVGIKGIPNDIYPGGAEHYGIAVPRAINDLDYSPVVIPTPDIERLDLQSPEYQSAAFLILACDGVWDVMSSTEAAKTVSAYLKAHPKDAKGAAESLANTALTIRDHDNVTAMVIVFEQPTHPATITQSAAAPSSPKTVIPTALPTKPAAPTIPVTKPTTPPAAATESAAAPLTKAVTPVHTLTDAEIEILAGLTANIYNLKNELDAMNTPEQKKEPNIDKELYKSVSNNLYKIKYKKVLEEINNEQLTQKAQEMILALINYQRDPSAKETKDLELSIHEAWTELAPDKETYSKLTRTISELIMPEMLTNLLADADKTIKIIESNKETAKKLNIGQEYKNKYTLIISILPKDNVLRAAYENLVSALVAYQYDPSDEQKADLDNTIMAIQKLLTTD